MMRISHTASEAEQNCLQGRAYCWANAGACARRLAHEAASGHDDFALPGLTGVTTTDQAEAALRNAALNAVLRADLLLHLLQLAHPDTGGAT